MLQSKQLNMPHIEVAGSGDGFSGTSLITSFRNTRKLSNDLAAPLSPEDQVVQAMPDASPTKWHLAHVTWFFETFILLPHSPNYIVFDERFTFLFNSYYEAVGARHARTDRGLLTRPRLGEVMRYRQHVDTGMESLLAHGSYDGKVEKLTELGINHEQQHQELMLMDILNLFSRNPLRPSYATTVLTFSAGSRRENWLEFEGGLYEVGFNGAGFAFDHEGPRHKVFVDPFLIANALVTNQEWLVFMADGGYERAELWLSDGIATARTHDWRAPLYWYSDDGIDWRQMTLHGERPINPEDPVGHVSYFEADAYSRWAGKRLPSETEWEIAAERHMPRGNTLGSAFLHPLPVGAENGGPGQFFGDLWEWTSSPYIAYPGYRTPEGAVGEYNGKFMSGQMVLRGGACVTPDGHISATYRNFFQPHQRWAFSGVRLAEDLI
jgi:ergothioneine biosynthesis protein EgtB